MGINNIWLCVRKEDLGKLPAPEDRLLERDWKVGAFAKGAEVESAAYR